METRMGARILHCLLGAALLAGLAGCGEKKKEASEAPVRGLRAYKVAATAESRARRFPSVLQPADVSSLAFEIGGQLKAVTLTVGQKVQLGEVLAEIDPRSLQTQVEQASAGVQQAQAQLDNAEGDFQRKEELLKRGVATQAVFDQSRATLLSSRAQLDQTRRQLEVGQAVDVKIADLPDLSLKGEIKELGSKAEQVSAFPVVIRLDNNAPGLNAGMSVEIT